MPNTIVQAAAEGLPTRRRALTALAGLGAALSLPRGAHAAADADPLCRLYAEAQALSVRVNMLDNGMSDEDSAAGVDRIEEIQRQAMATRPTTMAGAIVALQWAAREHETAREDGDLTDDFVGPMLANVIDFLRATGGAA